MQYKDFTITVNDGDGKPARWEPSGIQYEIEVERDDDKISFDYWDSYAAAQEGTEPDAQDAFAAWLGDALSAIQYPTESDFADAFGYEDCETLRSVFAGCNKALRQAEMLFLDEDSLIEILNDLNR